MPSSIEAVTTAALSAALDAGSRRHAALATNVANAQTQAYVPLRLSFDEQLAEVRTNLREKGALDAGALDILRSLREVEPAADESGSAVQLDVEMAELARNAVHFQALTQGLSRHMSLLALAAADGKK
jgi:flagellar basal-body rod protein FlgB